MSNAIYPQEITINVQALLHLEHTDKAPALHSILGVSGQVQVLPNTGDYYIVLETENNVSFSQISGFGCLIAILLDILIEPKQKAGEATKREQHSLAPLKNLLDLSDGEYDASMRMNFESGYAMQHTSVRKVTDTYYEAVVETFHRYPSSISQDITKILPNDITFTNAGAGKMIGRSQYRFQKTNGSIMTGDAEIEIDMVNQLAQLPQTEVFCYEYSRPDLTAIPLEMHVQSYMIGADTPPDMVDAGFTL